MLKKKHYLYLNESEYSILIKSLVQMKNKLTQQFVYKVTPTSDSTYDWYLNLSGTAKARATFTAEGRKKDCVIKLEEIEKISSLHTHPTANNQPHINNPLVFTLLHRLRSRMAGIK